MTAAASGDVDDGIFSGRLLQRPPLIGDPPSHSAAFLSTLSSSMKGTWAATSPCERRRRGWERRSQGRGLCPIIIALAVRPRNPYIARLSTRVFEPLRRGGGRGGVAARAVAVVVAAVVVVSALWRGRW